MPWKPAFENHAITLARAIVAFEQPLPQKVLRSAQRSVQGRQSELGLDTIRSVQDDMQMIEVRIGQGDGPPIKSPTSDSVHGLIFQKTAPVGDGASLRRMEEVGLRPLAFGYVADSYDRWAGFETRLFETLEEPLRQALLVVGVASVVLEYQDVFLYEGDPAAYRDLELFRRPFAHMQDGAVDPYRHWEVQTGWGTQEKTLPGWEVLYQRVYRGVQFGTSDTLEPKPAIHLMNRITLGASPSIQDDLDETRLREALNHAHSALNLQLIGTLSDDMNDRLNLRSENYTLTE